MHAAQDGATMTQPIAGDRKTLPTYCYQCVNGPDLLRVEVVDGVATKVEPNFDARGVHPADGKICVKPYGLIQKIYNPHRLLQPMKRTNPRKGRDEDPGWVPISWDEALDTVAEKLLAIRKAGLLDDNGDPKFAFSTGGAGTPLMFMGAFPAFFAAWGPIDMSLGAGGTVKCKHTEHLYGELWHRGFTVCPDTPLVEYVVSFGLNIDTSGGVTSVRRGADARVRGMKRVQIEPHLSVTGAQAKEWIPIRPKTDSAFLYAMVNVLLHEHPLEDLDVAFLKHRTASPYLIGPNGYYLRDAQSDKPLVWDLRSASAVAYDTADIDPALTGTFPVDAIERGADDEVWRHASIGGVPAHAKLMDHVAAHTPEWAASICDVAADTIRRIANEFRSHARIGETVVVDGRTLPFRPVAVTIGKSVNNGWGSYECVWARTVLMVLVGGLEVPGGLLGTTVLLSKPWLDHDRMATATPGPDGFLDYPFHPTDREHWIAKPTVRHAYSTLIPGTGDGPYAQAVGSTSLTWLRLQGRGAPSWPVPNPPEVWFVYRCNPLISFSETTRLGETIARFPFMVAFAYTLDETNHFADILLPDRTDLEGTQLVRLGGTRYEEQFWESRGWVLRQPVVEPQGDTREFTWIATELARRTDLLQAFNTMINEGVCGLPLKTDSYDFSLDANQPHEVEEIWDAVCRAASIDVTDGAASDGLDWFKEHGYRLKPFPRLNWYLYPRMVDLDRRFELPYQERVQRIGRQLANRLHENGIDWWDLQVHDYEALPEWKDVNALWARVYQRNFGADIADFPFWLLTARSMQYAWGGNVGIQLMREVAENVAGHSGIMINAAKAEAVGISEGDTIEVTSPVGQTRGRAILRQGVRPDVIVMIGQFGHWKTPFAKDIPMPSLNDLVPMSMDLIDGTGSSIDAVRVRVRVVERAR